MTLSEIYICPVTKKKLVPAAAEEIKKLNDFTADAGVQTPDKPHRQINGALKTADGEFFYEVREGIPILMPGAGMATTPAVVDDKQSIQSRYTEIEKEAATYDQHSIYITNHPNFGKIGETLRPGLVIPERDLGTFPKPVRLWLDTPISLLAQEKAYEWIAPLRGRRVLQMGGIGSHAVKFLVAGAAEAHLVSPSLGELRTGRLLSEKYGVADRFFPALGIAEQFPFADDTFDAIYGGGCLHHTSMEDSTGEIFRVMKKGGRAAFVEPRMTFWYNAARKVFSSRGFTTAEAGVETDRPIYRREIEAFISNFSAGQVHVSRTFCHIPITLIHRFFKVPLPLSLIYAIEKTDLFLTGMAPFLKRMSPIAAICVKK